LLGTPATGVNLKHNSRSTSTLAQNEHVRSNHARWRTLLNGLKAMRTVHSNQLRIIIIVFCIRHFPHLFVCFYSFTVVRVRVSPELYCRFSFPFLFPFRFPFTVAVMILVLVVVDVGVGAVVTAGPPDVGCFVGASTTCCTAMV
jgi:hypothetical protein